MVKKAAPLLGLRHGLVMVLDMLFSVSFDQDWTGDGRPIVWPSNRRLQELTGLGRSQVKAVLGHVFDLGLIAMRDSGNGHRWGQRNGAHGRITQAFGIDLSPLAARYDEFKAMVEEDDRRRAQARDLRAEISAVRRAVLTLADRGIAEVPEAAEWLTIAQRARRLATGCAAQPDPDVLGMILSQLRVVQMDAESVLRAAETARLPVETDPTGPAAKPHITTAIQLPTANATAKPQGRSTPDTQDIVRLKQTPSASSSRDTDALRGFPATPAFVIQAAPPFRGFIPSSRPSQADIVDAAWHVRKHLGISPSAWGEACISMGRWPAAVAVAVIAARYEAGEVRSPGGLLRKMIDLHDRGELRMDRSLYGLADRIKAASGQDVAVRQPRPG
jgi:replication initiation protein RepC